MPRPTLLRYRKHRSALHSHLAGLMTWINRVSLSLFPSSLTLTVPFNKARPMPTLLRSSRRVSPVLCELRRERELITPLLRRLGLTTWSYRQGAWPSEAYLRSNCYGWTLRTKPLPLGEGQEAQLLSVVVETRLFPFFFVLSTLRSTFHSLFGRPLDSCAFPFSLSPCTLLPFLLCGQPRGRL